MNNKKFVIDFLCSDYYKDKSVYKDFIHKNVEISWNSSEGFSKLNYGEFQNIVLEMGKSFSSLTPEISHALEENNTVAIRFTYHVETLEHPESLPLAHFISIWEIKDNKVFKIYIMSHAADENIENIASYLNL